ncbi:MAG TPA: DUF4382 domain-containing protein [Burkholderiaceae bacterium]|nr:DUF4382 domain-containing protein [Burkholderiaceae bacterium]
MTIKHLVNKLKIPVAIGAVALLSACGGGGGTSQGTLQVSLTDAPACGFDQVNVTVNKVRVHQSATAGDTDGGWHEIVLDPARKIDLLSLTNGVLEDLGQTPLPVGHYTQLRLVLDANHNPTALANSVVPTDSSKEIALDTPSGVQSGIKLIHEFDVTENTLVDLVLDFDACKSVVPKGDGSFALKPVISVIPKVVSGGIAGYITPGTPKAVVTAQQNGIVVKSTVPDATTGAFTLAPLLPSSTNYVVVITADGRTTAAISGIPVVTGTNTALSTSAAPIALPASAIRTISGAVTPAAAQATVRATQTFASGGPQIEVGFSLADLTAGAYSLSLPVAAPLLGQFGTGTLPIAFTADSSIAGKYTVEASATGYGMQTFNVDISAANVTKDFALVAQP